MFSPCQRDRRWGQSWTDTCKFVRHLGLASCAIVKMKVRLGYVHENESRSIAFFLISNTKKKPKYLQFWLYFLWWHKSAFISQKHSQTPLLRPDYILLLCSRSLDFPFTSSQLLPFLKLEWRLQVQNPDCVCSVPFFIVRHTAGSLVTKIKSWEKLTSS